MFDDKKNARQRGLAGHGRVAGFIGFSALLSGGWAGAQQPTTGPQASEGEALESIVVTARRREESLQDTPVAVTASAAEALERQQATGTMDLDKIAPNIQFHSYGTLTGNNSAAQVFIRGIGQTDATPAVDPGVGIYIDDVYMGRAVGGAMDFRDIANVQILRGPQGTLFGRNTIGGAGAAHHPCAGRQRRQFGARRGGRRQSARTLRCIRFAAGRRLVGAPRGRWT
jgi:iron complex outermembrane receptor protein